MGRKGHLLYCLEIYFKLVFSLSILKFENTLREQEEDIQMEDLRL